MTTPPPDRATAARLCALLALERLSPDLLSAVVADGAVVQKLGIHAVARPLEFGQGYTVGRDELFAAFEQAADGKVPTVQVAHNGATIDATVSIVSDGAALVEAATIRARFDHAALWAQDRERREQALVQSLQIHTLCQALIARLEALVLTDSPTFESFRQATDILNTSPEVFAAMLEPKLVTGKIQQTDLVPDDPRYWDNLTAEWRISSTLADYIEGELRQEREARYGRFPSLAKAGFALQFVGQELVPHEWLGQWGRDEVFGFVELLGGYEDHNSLVAGFEVCASQLTRDPRLVAVGEHLLDRLFGDFEMLLNTCRRFAAAFVLATVRLARQEGTRTRPVFWRRLAAATHAALVARTLGRGQFGTEELFDWAMEVSGEYFMLSVYREMGTSPRWQPEWIEPDSLAADAFGRILQAANALAVGSAPPTWLEKISRAQQWFEHRSLISRAYLPSLTQGERPISIPAVAEVLRVRAEELYRELCAQPTAQALIRFADITELTGIPPAYCEGIALAFSKIFAIDELEKEWVQSALAVSARMALTSQNPALAELVGEMILKVATRNIETIGVFGTVIRLLECAAADPNSGPALSKMARRMESLALTQPAGAAQSTLFATLRKLQRLDGDQAPLWARAANTAKLGILSREILKGT